MAAHTSCPSHEGGPHRLQGRPGHQAGCPVSGRGRGERWGGGGFMLEKLVRMWRRKVY